MQKKEGEEMSFKPSDFFLSIVSFLGVLLPGAVFVFLRGASVQAVFAPKDFEPRWRWAVAAVSAYVAGQILLAVTEPLNSLAEYVAARTPHVVHRILSVFKKHDAPQPAETGDFHKAISYVRLRNTEAAAEIDRHMADYKLLRNLIAVFLIDAVWSLFDRPRIQERTFWASLLTLLSFVGFVRMHYWARLLAFQYRDLLILDEK
jgi:hypothetical protein